MAKRKPIYGIWIEADTKAEIKRKRELHADSLIYKTIVGHSKENRKGQFVTNQAVSKIIQRVPGLIGETIGAIDIDVRVKTNRIWLQSFYPFKTGEDVKKLFEKTGLSRFIFHAITKELARDYPGFKMQTRGYVFPRMVKMLERMNLATSRPYSSKTWAQRSGDAVARGLRERHQSARKEKSDLAPEKSIRGIRERKLEKQFRKVRRH